MKTTYGLAKLLPLLLVASPFAKADVILNSASLLVGSGYPFPEYSWSALLVDGNALESGLGVQIGHLGNGDYEFRTGLIALPYHLFLSYPGMEFTPAYVEANWADALDAGFPPKQLHFGTPNQTHYFAYWADAHGSDISIPDGADDYGWVTMAHTGNELVVRESVTAHGGGIVVGTTTQLPEPASAILLGLGFLAVYITTLKNPSIFKLTAGRTRGW